MLWVTDIKKQVQTPMTTPNKQSNFLGIYRFGYNLGYNFIIGIYLALSISFRTHRGTFDNYLLIKFHIVGHKRSHKIIIYAYNL